MLRILCIFFLLISLTGCSWFSNRQTLFDSVDAEKKPAAEKAEKRTAMKAFVPREQYQSLLREYEMLKRQNQLANAVNKPTTDKKLIDEIKKVKSQSKPQAKPGLGNTVDVMPKREQVKINPGVKTFKNNTDSEISQLNRAISLVDKKKYDEALGLLKPLERSPILAIKARARFYIGELLFDQKEYDLAMQVYESLLKTNSGSGLVVSSIGRLIVCSRKLNLKEKEDEYFSLLKVFGVES